MMETGGQAFAAKTTGYWLRSPTSPSSPHWSWRPAARSWLPPGPATTASHHADAHPERHHPSFRHDPRDRACSAPRSGGGGGVNPAPPYWYGRSLAGGGLRKAAGGKGGQERRDSGGGEASPRCQNPVLAEVWPDCFPASAERRKAAGSERRRQARQAAGRQSHGRRTTEHRRPATGSETARATTAKPQERTAMARELVPPATMASPDPSGGNRP